MPDLSYEKIAWKAGRTIVAGVDEAGRGPLAGSVVAGAVVLPRGFKHAILNDSKKLSERQREALYEELTSGEIEGLIWASGSASPREIEKINILKATHLAMRRAVEKLTQSPDHVLIDGLPVPGFPISSEGIVKGDGKSLSIAAASIIAKVERDREMLKLARKYPEYGFEAHKGYGTKRHLEALKKHGICPIHRKTFAPVAQLTLPLD
jgi:ribonuclease HII